jgi:hypothetical protein
MTTPISITKRFRANDPSTIETVVETFDVPDRFQFDEAETKLLVEGLLSKRFWTQDMGNHRQTPAAQRERHAIDALLVKMGCDQDQLDLLDRVP